MNFEEICEANKKANNGYLSCDLSNFRGCCKLVQEALDNNDLEKAVHEMYCLTGIFSEVSPIHYERYRIHTGNPYDMKFRIPKHRYLDSKEIITKDFECVKEKIRTFIEENYHFGEFEVTKAVLTLPHWCVDWDFYNKNTDRFVEICRKTDAKFGLDKAQQGYDRAYREEHNALDVYFSRHNQRCYLKFASISDAADAVGIYETEYGEYNEEDGTIWVDVPFSC